MQKMVILALMYLIGTGLALDEPGTFIEAKVYIDGTRSFDRLGDLASDLYICSQGTDEKGPYLVLVTNAKQLAQVTKCGLETKVTWANLDEKFKLITGVDPKDVGRLQDFGYYYTYREMCDSVTEFATAHPEICSLFVIGTTSQGRSILCLKISDNATLEEDEPACYFSGACHGNEPMGTSIVMEFLRRILSDYGVDPITTWLVDNREIYTVPILNPDCSVYCSDSGGAGVYWRKNRRIVVPPNIGVDPSRNHGYKWGYDDIGSSPNPASHAYRGPYRWSDAEAVAARDLAALRRFRTEQDFHCCGRWNMYPWSWTTASPPDEAALQEANDTLRMYNGYPANQAGQISRVFYPCNGTQPDWALTDTAGKFSTYSFDIEADTWFYACWNDSALMRQEVDGNVPGLFYLARIAGVYLNPVSVTVNDTLLGNSSGQLDPGESANLWFTIRNQALHPLDSAYNINAQLISEDTNVIIVDSLKSFPNVRRRAIINNSAEQFEVRASNLAQSGDTISLRLELSFFDAGNAITQQLRFAIVLGDNHVGLFDNRITSPILITHFPTVIRSVLFMPDFSEQSSTNFSRDQKFFSSGLFDITGSKILNLHPGVNDIRHIAPGVYFVRNGLDPQSQRITILR